MITFTLKRFLLLLAFFPLLSPLVRAQDNAIFRNGQPQEVKETSYVIRDGVKVENKKSGGLFGWRNNNNRKPISAMTNGGNADVPIFDTPAGPAPAPAPQSSAEPTVPTPAPAPAPVQTKRKSLLSLPSLPSLPRFRRKDDAPIDTSNAQILVNNGGTLTPADGSEPEDYRVELSNPTSSASNPQPPKMENGSVVYESWDDVEFKKVSAAEQIVKSMKAQEAEHQRKVAQAKKDYEEQVRKAQEAAKKAQEEARIRAIMSGGVSPTAPGPGL